MVSILRTLGGTSVLRARSPNYDAIIEQVRSGLPYSALETVAARFRIPQEDLVRVLALPPRTLARRKKGR
ncbi:MAG: antitoxin Xre-like helix-turn-helix domain-containing protein, partial [Gemmatimonadota bacterium]